MAYFQWEDKYDLGVDKMNDEHQVLIDLMNKLYEENDKKSDKFVINQCINKLADWTKVHFAHEEAYMEEIGFPGIKQHKLIHQNLLSELDKYATEYHKGTENQISPKFFSFLKLWLQAHIIGIDMKYGEHAKAA